MVKLVIMDWKQVKAQTIRDVERRVPQKEGKIIYVDSLEALRSLMTKGRLSMLSEVHKGKPGSLYELARSMKKDIKTVATDAKILSEMGLLELKAYKEGGRKKVRPVTRVRKISVEVPI